MKTYTVVALKRGLLTTVKTFRGYDEVDLNGKAINYALQYGRRTGIPVAVVDNQQKTIFAEGEITP